MDRGDKILAWLLSVLLLAIAVIALIDALPEGANLVAHVQHSEIYRNYALIAGGLIGFALALWRISLLDEQTKIAERDLNQREVDSDRVSAQRKEEHTAGRFERAVDLLNSEELQFKRYGAIRMMDIATANPDEYLTPAIHLLSAAVREIAKKETMPRESTDPVHDVVREMVTYIFEMGDIYESSLGGVAPINIHNSYFSHVRLSEKNISLRQITGCVFVFSTFSECSFYDRSFEGASFLTSEFNNCDFSDALFGRTNFTDTNFEHCRADRRTWRECDLTDTYFNCLEKGVETEPVFVKCNLNGATFSIDTNNNQSSDMQAQKVASNPTAFEYHPRQFLHCFVSTAGMNPIASGKEKVVMKVIQGEKKPETEKDPVPGYYVQVENIEAGDED